MVDCLNKISGMSGIKLVLDCREEIIKNVCGLLALAIRPNQ
jgi:hypothetical protein